MTSWFVCFFKDAVRSSRGSPLSTTCRQLDKFLKKMRECNTEAHLKFVGLQKAFDTICHESAWYTLAIRGVPKKEAIDMIKNLYDNAVAYMKLDEVKRKILNRAGVEQGDPLSLYMFNGVLEQAF